MHDCAGLNCGINPTGATHCQEGQEQAITIPAIEHSKNAQYILNTNMIRSGHHLRGLYGYIPQHHHWPPLHREVLETLLKLPELGMERAQAKQTSQHLSMKELADVGEGEGVREAVG
jgi:hypothetical protein